MWPGGVKPSSSHRTSIESNVATRQLTVATVQGHPLPRSKRETEGYYQPVSSLETKMTSPTAMPATTRLPIPLEMQDRDCKGTFGCHSFGLNSDPASAISCASDELPLDFRRTTRRQLQLDVLPLDSHSSANLASAPLPLPLLFRDPVNISCLLFT